MTGPRALRNPICAAAVLIGLAAVALPTAVRADEAGATSAANLSMPELRTDDGARHAGGEAKAHSEKKSKQTVRRTGKDAPPRRQTATMVPRTTFEDRTAHYFDPLTLTLTPENRIDPATSEYNQVTGSFVGADKGQVAVVPSDPTTRDISSASIENMGQGKNVTVVVPLFQILNSLSPGPAAEP